MSATEQPFPAPETARSLCEQIVAGNCVLFVGPGTSAGTTERTGLPTRAELTEALWASWEWDEKALSPGDTSFPWVAQCYEIEQGRALLLSFLKEKMQVVQEPLPLQRAIAALLFPLITANALPFPLILTTSYDVLLEKALHEKGIVYQQLIGDHELTHKQPGVVRMVKLYGCITQPESMVITEEDHFAFLHRWPQILDALEREFSGRAILFMGCDLKDRDFRHLYYSLVPRLGEAGLAYALQMGLAAPLAHYWAARGLTVIEADAVEFLERVAESIPAETVEEGPSEPLLEPLKLQVAQLTVTGRSHRINEDRLEVCMPSALQLIDKRGNLFIVADGMGGHNAGEIASRLAADTIVEEYYANTAEDIPASLTRAIEAANRAIYQQAGGNPAQRGMGTTVVAAAVRGRELHVANVGNSRAYLVHDKTIDQITLDHTLSPPQNHILTRALGPDRQVEVDIFQRKLGQGDIIVLCSDGLTECVRDGEIKKVVSKHSPQSAVKQLVRLAKDGGGWDDISVMVIKVSEESALRKAMGRLGLR